MVPGTVESQFFSRLLQLLGCSRDGPDPEESAIADKTEEKTGGREGDTEREEEEEGEGGSGEGDGGGAEETAASRAQLGVNWSSVLERTAAKRSGRQLLEGLEGPAPIDVPLLEAVRECLALLLKYGVYQVSGPTPCLSHAPLHDWYTCTQKPVSFCQKKN